MKIYQVFYIIIVKSIIKKSYQKIILLHFFKQPHQIEQLYQPYLKHLVVSFYL